jgi:hypothetical protein
MVLRRIVNGTIVGGMLGAAMSNHMAQEHWRTKHMVSERNAMGLPFFRERLATDWPMTQQDLDRWDAMGRNHRHGQGAIGGALGAVAGAAAAGLATRSDSPRRSPERMAYVDPNDPHTLHVPDR